MVGFGDDGRDGVLSGDCGVLVAPRGDGGDGEVLADEGGRTLDGGDVWVEGEELMEGEAGEAARGGEVMVLGEGGIDVDGGCGGNLLPPTGRVFGGSMGVGRDG